MHTYPQPLMEGDEQMDGSGNYQLESEETGKYPDSVADSRPHREKLNSILILSIGFFALIIAGISMWINLANPFASIIKAGQEQAAKSAAEEQKALLVLQTKDTDGDGLTDYSETNTYGTSPYLKDSDGDNIDDKTEVAKGTDPNCPEGQTCQAETGASAATSSSAAPQLQTSLANPAIEITPAYIRQIMKSNGATDEQLEALTDDELMEAFRDYLAANPQAASDLAAQGYDVNVGAAQTSAALSQSDAGNADLASLNVSSVDDLKKLTGAQIRQLMISSGASESVLAQVTDDQLKEMFLSQLNSNTKTTQ